MLECTERVAEELSVEGRFRFIARSKDTSSSLLFPKMFKYSSGEMLGEWMLARGVETLNEPSDL